MKNTHIKTLEEVVPAEIRLEVYKETLIDIKNKRSHYSGLCICIPVALWGLKTFLEDGPDGYNWKYYNTAIAFPEIEPILKKIMDENDAEKRQQLRIKGLEEIIKNWKS